MTLAVFHKLLAIFLTVALGYIAGRLRWLGADGPATARVLGNAAFYVFVPALLFRTTARLDFAALPWHTVTAFFVPVLVVLLGVYLVERGRAARRARQPHAQAPGSAIAAGPDAGHGAAAPSVRAIAGTFGNSVQVGIPFAAALFGEPGLGIHIALVSLHALVLLSVLTALAELDLARARARREDAPPLWRTLATTLHNTIVHPVVLPVLAGLAWNVGGLGLHPVVDETLVALGSAVVPVCLVLIGITLAAYSVRAHLRGAIGISLIKLLLLPALVLAVGRWGFGLAGLPLAVVVMMAALPVGANALIFAQRYETLEAEATAAIVFSTASFVLTATFWLGVLAWLAR